MSDLLQKQVELSSAGQARVVPFAVVSTCSPLPHWCQTAGTVALCKDFPAGAQQTWPQGIHLQKLIIDEHFLGPQLAHTYDGTGSACLMTRILLCTHD